MKPTRSGGLAVLIALAGFMPAAGQPSASARSPKAVEQKLSQATEFVRAGRLDQARGLLDEVLRADPRSLSANTLAGIVAEQNNDLAAAEKHFSLAARLHPGAAEARNNYGAILARLNRPADAAREFEAALSHDPSRLSSLVNLAKIRWDQNRLAEARRLFERAAAISADVEIQRGLLLISLRGGEKDRAAAEADTYLEMLKRQGAEKVEWEKEALAGRALLAGGMADKAGSLVELGLAAAPGNVELLVLASQAYLGRGDVRAAGKVLESAVAGGAADARVYAALAEVYKSGGFYENAIPAMQIAIEKDPGNEFYRARYGTILVDSKAPAAAVIRLNEYLKQFPRSARLWLALGIAQQADGKSTEAKHSFERALSIDRTSVPALAYLATSQVEQADYLSAVKTFEAALSLDERNAVLHYLLADTLLKIPGGDNARVMKHLNRAVELEPALASARFALGKVYARDEKWAEALAQFEETIRHAPELAEAHYQKGRMLARLKRSEESKASFQRHKELTESRTAKEEATRQDLVRRLADVRY